ncbi:MAG: hypothetical protein KGZ59_00565 [Chitinophagaceae bacterium]|nr:hypothetical protein [Chitinophagaceae bacterium]
MSQHQENTTYVKNFTLTAFLSFGILLGLLLLLSKCHGNYMSGHSEHHNTEQTQGAHH